MQFLDSLRRILLQKFLITPGTFLIESKPCDDVVLDVMKSRTRE